MNSQAEHLSEETSSQLDKSPEERKEFIRLARWIGYPRAAEILKHMGELLRYPPKPRMPGMLLAGETNNGKTTLVERFSRLHPAYDSTDGESIEHPVLIIRAPEEPDDGRFWNVLLNRLFAPYKLNDHVDKKRAQVIQIMRRIRVKMLVIDEIHNILVGTVSKQRQFLVTLKNLTNDLQIVIVLVGTQEAMNAISSDPQIVNRFPAVVLHRWQFDDNFRRLLASFERLLPLPEPSRLADEDTAKRIFHLSEGLIGETATLVTEAACRAVDQDLAKITVKTFDLVEWTRPSERRSVRAL
ncbi:MAG: TniB family NTP-binding protein [Blastocatellia bacterium]|nr:TniB family NTP-binding protein [Blastocatellia bacterium]